MRVFRREWLLQRGTMSAWAQLWVGCRRRVGALRWRTVALLVVFACVVAYAGLLAPHRPLFGWMRVVPLDIDEPPEEPKPGDRNIFFLETSCVAAGPPPSSQFLTESGLRLSPRGACALEAAAIANPTRPIFLAHSCSVDAERMWRGEVPAYALAAVSLPNVHVWPLAVGETFAGSPLEQWFKEGLQSVKGEMAKEWRDSRVRDALRYLLLWRYGGTYLDMDVLVLKSLEDDHDFVPTEWSGRLSAVVLDMSWSGVGRRLANATLLETTRLRPAAGLHSEADAALAALSAVCGTSKVSEMTAERCGGFMVLSPSAVYPVAFERWWDLFEERAADNVMAAVSSSLAVHAWNKLSADAIVDTSSRQPFAQIARLVCPGVVAAVGDYM